MCQQHSHILQGWNSQAKAQFFHQTESQAICKPMDLGSRKSLSPKLTQLCPILSKGDAMPAYGANTPFAHCYSFQNKQVYDHAIIPSVQGSHEKPSQHRGQHHHPALRRPAADLSPFQEPLSASQPSNTTLPTSTTCSALACTTTALGGQNRPWHGADPCGVCSSVAGTAGWMLLHPTPLRRGTATAAPN